MHPFHAFIRSLVHRLLAALILLAVLPIFAIFYVLMKVIGNQKEPFFYRGERLGRHKKPFMLYKIRTLPDYAGTVLANNLFRPGHDQPLKYGGFLRKSRVDELPQLINVIKGDMVLVGPRPVRPSIARLYSSKLRLYDKRFAVRPGLTGYSQLFTAHRTPKRIRAALDNHFVEHHSGLHWDFAVITDTAYRAVRRACVELISVLSRVVRTYRVHRRVTELRALPRVQGNSIECCLTDEDFKTDSAKMRHPVHDLDYQALRFPADVEFESGDCITFVLHKRLGRGNKVRRAKCHGMVFCQRLSEDGNSSRKEYVVFYTPATEFSRYIIDQYMLDEKL